MTRKSQNEVRNFKFYKNYVCFDSCDLNVVVLII